MVNSVYAVCGWKYVGNLVPEVSFEVVVAVLATSTDPEDCINQVDQFANLEVELSLHGHSWPHDLSNYDWITVSYIQNAHVEKQNVLANFHWLKTIMSTSRQW